MNSTTNIEFLQLYKPIHEQFIKYCSSFAYGIMETEDLAQEAVLSTLQNFAKIKDKRKLLHYMIGVVRNITFNQRRRQKFKSTWEDELLEKLESKVQSPEIALDIHFLLKAMEELPEKQKEAILLFEISGFSMKEISVIQDSSIAATKTRISRGRTTLKQKLSEDTSKSSLANRLAAFASILF